jgi:hypothetical protein
MFQNIQLMEHMEECTIGVALGSATSDGRPMLWKTRDMESSPNNEVIYMSNIQVPYILPYSYICVSNAEIEAPWMGVNEHGFAIINSYSGDLIGGNGPGNGEVMWYVLGKCATIDEFQHILDSTNITGRSTQSNFAVIDSTGAGAIFETGGDFYIKFDAADTPDNYIIRTNFSITGGGVSGMERFLRSTDLISDFYHGDSLNPKSILRYQMRDFSDTNSEPIPVPYQGQWSPSFPVGYIPTHLSICRNTSVSTSVIQGILEGENPSLSTLWAIIGNPAASIATPYWPVGETPPLANGIVTAPLCDLALTINDTLYNYNGCNHCINTYMLKNEEGSGLWPCFFSEEDIIMGSAQGMLEEWRGMESLPIDEMLAAEITFTETAYSVMESCFSVQLGIEGIVLNDIISVFPIPAHQSMTIEVNEPDLNTSVEFHLYDFLGREVFKTTFQDKYLLQRNGLSNGIYNWRAYKEGRVYAGKIIWN